MTYDLIIVGGGAAGLTAAVYSVRCGLDFALLDPASSMGSQLALTDEIDNYTGFEKIGGIELLQKFHAHAKALGTPMINDEARLITKDGGVFKIEGAKGEYLARSVIYCAGAQHRTLGVKGEREFTGRGVSYCAVCDGFFYRGKIAAVIGGGNTAAGEALYLSKFCEKVYLIHRRDTLRADKSLTDKLEKAENIELVYSAEADEITGDKSVSAIRLKSGKELLVDGVFIAVGTQPRTQALGGLAQLDKHGYIVADESGKTSVEGLFCAGDVRSKALRQIVTACSDGANAANSANEFLNR